MELVAYWLEGQAEQWYQAFLMGKSPDLSLLSWEEFFKAFMIRFLPASRKVSLAVEFEKLSQVQGMTVSEYDDHFSQLSRHVLHMVPTDALRTGGFIRGLANPMFTTLSSHVGRITYTEAMDASLHIKAGQQKRKANREAAKKPKSRGSFSKGPSSGFPEPARNT